VNPRSSISSSIVKGFLFCAVSLFSYSNGATIKASAGSLSAVQAALNTAASGDIIVIPAGSSTWTGPLKITKTNITLQGNGIGSTVITGNGQVFNTSGESANSLRITGVELRSCTNCFEASGSGSPKQAIKNLRIDNSKFVNAYIVLETQGGATGVIDHCTFQDSYGARLYGSNDANVKFPLPLGTSDAVFFEDNVINVSSSGTPPHFIASNSFSKYVIRHNTFNYSKSLWDIVDAHGYCEVAGRGSATWEIYENTFNLVSSLNRVIHLRGGEGVVFNNKFVNYKPTLAISLTDYSYCHTPCVQSCSGYPCKDQINRSYFWNNTFGATVLNPVSDCNIVQVSRDYYNSPAVDYTPYTYPHPLTVLGKSTQPPTSVTQNVVTVSGVTGLRLVSKPLSPITSISYSLEKQSFVKLSIFNAEGVLVTTLVNRTESAGNHVVSWDATSVTKGIYIVKADLGNHSFTERIVR
jgi:hypothetical protein